MVAGVAVPRAQSSSMICRAPSSTRRSQCLDTCRPAPPAGDRGQSTRDRPRSARFDSGRWSERSGNPATRWKKVPRCGPLLPGPCRCATRHRGSAGTESLESRCRPTCWQPARTSRAATGTRGRQPPNRPRRSSEQSGKDGSFLANASASRLRPPQSTCDGPSPRAVRQSLLRGLARCRPLRSPRTRGPPSRFRRGPRHEGSCRPS